MSERDVCANCDKHYEDHEQGTTICIGSGAESKWFPKKLADAITLSRSMESAPPQPVAAQEKHGMLMCKRRGCNVGGTGTLINGYCYQHQPSPAATTQPKPAPQAEGFEEHPEFPDCDCIAPADCPKNGTQKPECAESFNVWNCIGSNPSSWDDLDESDQLRWKRAMSAAQAPLLEKIAELESALRREERDSDQLMNERDEAVDVAERLSDAISKYFKTDIGEHSNLNDPFENAVEVIESRIAELESAQPKKDEVFDLLWQDFIDEAEVEPSPEEEGFARWGWNMASGDYGHGFIDGREAGYHTCGSCGHPWEAHDGECSAHVKDGSICGCPRVISAQPKAEPVEQLVSDITLDVIAAKYPKEDAAHQMAVELQQYRQREERSGE